MSRLPTGEAFLFPRSAVYLFYLTADNRRMRSNAAKIIVLLVLCVSPRVATQEPQLLERYDVAWLEYEAAERLAEGANQRNDAEALRRYSRAIEMNPLFPEAYVGMARVYDGSGDDVLAERYYQRALELSQHLQVSDEKYAIRVELARMYDRRRGDEYYDKKYANELLKIIEDDPTFSLNDPPGQREQMVTTLFSSGLNRVIVLYRLDFPASLEAHRLYATYLLDKANPSADEVAAAIEHLLFAVVEMVGRGVNAIIDREFDYQFTTIAEMIDRTGRYRKIRDYFRTEDLVGLLRDLAIALEASERTNAGVRSAGILEQIAAVADAL